MPPQMARTQLGMLGYPWPEGDEAKLLEMRQAWMTFPNRLQSGVADAHAGTRGVWTDNQDTAIDIAQAIATTGPALGAPLAEIPIFKEITSLIPDHLTNMAREAVLGG